MNSVLLGFILSFLASCTPTIIGERPSTKALQAARANARGSALRWEPEVSITNLQALGVGWQLSTEQVSGVRVEFFSGPGCEVSIDSNLTFSGAIRNANFTALTDGVYSFRVVTMLMSGGENLSLCSAPMEVDTREPNAPGSLAWHGGITSSSTTLVADWVKSNSTDVVGQTIRFFQGAGCSGSAVFTESLGPSSVSASFGGGVDGGTYSFSVTTRDGAGNETVACSGGTTVVLGPSPSPTAPSNLVAAGGQSHVDLTWSAASGEGLITYRIYRSTSLDGAFETLESAHLGTSFSDLSVTNGTTYYYFVTANFGAEQSDATSTVSARSISTFGITGVIVNNESGPSALRVSWGAAIGADRYTVQFRNDSGSHTGVQENVSSPHIITGLTPGAPYHVMVVARNTVGSGASVNATSEVVGTPMSRPGISSVNPLSPGSLSVIWNGGAGASGFSLKYRIPSETEGTVIGSASSPEIVTGLSPDTEYRIMVTASNSSGSLDAEGEFGARTLIPEAPALASASILNQNPSPITGFLLSYGEITGSYESYCILENDTDVGHCAWTNGTLPGIFAVSNVENAKRLSIWIKDGYGQHSVRRDTTNVVAFQKELTQSLITAGEAHTCSIVLGKVWCWGKLLRGSEIFGGSEVFVAPSPEVISGFENPVAVDAGAGFTCALKSDGSVFCWGAAPSLGSGAFLDMAEPSPVWDISNAIAISAGKNHACALLQNGTIKCWGSSDSGQVGSNVLGSYPTPVQVPGIQGAIGIAAGGSHTCALLADRKVKCWGRGAEGQLGNTELGNLDSPNPVLVSDAGNAISISAGDSHTCAVRDGGSVKCWGSDSLGQLGSGSESGDLVSAGWNHSCILTDQGTVRCWGDNSHGQLGGLAQVDPVGVSGVENAIAIASGAHHSCAVLMDGNARCWGFDQGQLGYTYETIREIPSPLVGETVQVAYPPMLSSATITNSNPTNSRQFSLSYGDVIGGPEKISYTHYCILENEGDISGCNDENGRNWSEGQLPQTFQVSNNQGEKVLSIWLAYAEDNRPSRTRQNPRTDTNSVSLADVLPSLMSATITNSNPSKTTGYNLSYTGISGYLTHYCILENNPNVEACTWVQGQLPAWFEVSASENEKVLSIWVKDNLDRVSPRVDTNSIPYQKPVLPSIVSAGYGKTCVILGGSIRCWGENWAGQLGDGTLTSSNAPVVVSGIEAAVAISVGGSHSCALRYDGSVWCWGRNHDGQLGISPNVGSNVPVQAMSSGNATAISAGQDHTCALIPSGKVLCWGQNSFGVLGDGSTTDSSEPVEVSGITNAVSISSGSYHACAVLSNGGVKCWGRNYSGQLGNGSTVDSNIPVEVTGLSNVIAVSAGFSHSCALQRSGLIRCWGANDSGKLGTGSHAPSSVPASVAIGVSNAVAVSSGSNHTCALLSDQTVKCWGSQFSLTPGEVSGITHATGVSAGYQHTCISLSDGSIRCWGLNTSGQLGDGVSLSSADWGYVNGVQNPVSISVGSGFSCSVFSDGVSKCWGYGGSGALGVGFGYSNKYTPQSVLGITNAAKVSAGGAHACAVLADGSVWCWGSNSTGQLGNASSFSPVPSQVTGVANAVGIAAGDHYDGHTCALISDGTVKCWGSNQFGQLGDGTTTSSNSPVSVSSLGNSISIAAGGSHTCALRSGGDVVCWGLGFTGNVEKGPGGVPIGNPYVPMAVGGVSNAVAITAGSTHTCALLNGGAMKCWGSNQYGQLGDGTLMGSSIPVDVVGITNAVAISAGSSHTCAALSNGRVQCWGWNESGQLGNGATANSPIPVLVSNVSNAVAISAGYGHTCATLESGFIRCWGMNYAGEFGNGMPTISLSSPRNQVRGLDLDSSSPLSSLQVLNSTAIVGSAVNIQVQLTQPSGEPWSGVTPLIAATDTGNTNSSSCTETDSTGQATCTLSSNFAEQKEVWLLWPVQVRAEVPANGKVTFTPSSYQQVRFNTNPTLKQGICSETPYALSAVDAFNNPVPASSTIGIEVGSTSGGPMLFADPQCTVGLGGAIMIPGGATSSVFYMKGNYSGVFSLPWSFTGGDVQYWMTTVVP